MSVCDLKFDEKREKHKLKNQNKETSYSVHIRHRSSGKYGVSLYIDLVKRAMLLSKIAVFFIFWLSVGPHIRAYN